MINNDLLRHELIRASMACFGYSVFINSQEPTYAHERQAICYVLKEYYKYSNKDIGVICRISAPHKHDWVIYSHKVVRNQLPLYDLRQRSVTFWNNIVRDYMDSIGKNDRILNLLDRLSQSLQGEDATTIDIIKMRLGYVK